MAVFQNPPASYVAPAAKANTTDDGVDKGVWNTLKPDQLRAMAPDNPAVAEMATAIEEAVAIGAQYNALRTRVRELATMLLVVPEEHKAKGRVLIADIKYGGLNYGFAKPYSDKAANKAKAEFILK